MSRFPGNTNTKRFPARKEDGKWHCLADVVPFFPGKVCIAHTPLNLWLMERLKGYTTLPFHSTLRVLHLQVESA